MKTVVKEHIEEVRNGNVNIKEFIQEVVERSQRIQKKYAPFITLIEKPATAGNGIIDSLPISVKDSICTKGIMTTAGSKILEGYVPPFDATSVANAKGDGGIIIGKTALDEFGFGTFSVNCAYGIPKNPHDTTRSCGGSSGGAACLTAAADFPHVAIAQSTGGSITAPAAFTGTVGITPTYGRVSRYGLIDYSNSMDKIGTIGKTVYDASLLLSSISGYDKLDSTSAEIVKEDFTSFDAIDGVRIGIPKEYFSEGVDRRVAKEVRSGIERLESLGATCEEMSLPMTDYGIASYYITAISEASTNLARYCGLRYGMQKDVEGDFDAYFSSIRSTGFGQEAKRRIILGTYARMAGFRDAYYIKALRIRTKIINEFAGAFKRFDVLIAPSMPIIAPTFSEIASLSPVKAYGMDVLTVPPNMAGIPHVSVPVGKVDSMPVGMQVMAAHFKESNAIRVAAAMEGAA